MARGAVGNVINGNDALRLILLTCAQLCVGLQASRGAEFSPPPSDQPTITYHGMSDASAAVALDQRTFLVADDEQSTFCVYRIDRPEKPLQRISCEPFLGHDGKRTREADLEGAAARGQRVYWIGSHGRNRKGKWAPGRQQFFAVEWESRGEEILVRPFGVSYRRLAHDLAEDTRLKALGVAESIQPEIHEKPELAPKRDGLNIEGLAAASDGRSLLIGFRNPRPQGKALVVPLRNPDAILQGNQRAELGAPILLDLTRVSNGKQYHLGIRDMALAPSTQGYWLLAGAHDERPLFAVFEWDGVDAQPPRCLPQATQALATAPSFSPEAVLFFPNSSNAQLLSDDGSLLVAVGSPAECKKGAFRAGKCEAKSLLDDSRKTFRGRWIARG